MATQKAPAPNVGRVVQIIGPVVDVEFAAGAVPPIYQALRIQDDGSGGVGVKIDVVAEVSARLLGELVTNAPPKDREVEAAKARARAAERFAA